MPPPTLTPSPFHWHISPATAAFPPVQLPKSLSFSPSSPPPPVTPSPHHTTPQWSSLSCGSVLHVLCGMFSGPTCFNCTVWFNWGKKGVEKSMCEIVQVWVRSLLLVLVESDSIWTVTNYLCFDLSPSTLNLKWRCFTGVKQARY